MLLKIKKANTTTKSFEKKTSRKWQKVFKFVKVCIRITLVHKNSRKIEFFGDFFISTFLVCQRAQSTYVKSQKITNIVVFPSFFSFIGVLKLTNSLKNAIQ